MIYLREVQTSIPQLEKIVVEQPFQLGEKLSQHVNQDRNSSGMELFFLGGLALLKNNLYVTSIGRLLLLALQHHLFPTMMT